MAGKVQVIVHVDADTKYEVVDFTGTASPFVSLACYTGSGKVALFISDSREARRLLLQVHEALDMIATHEIAQANREAVRRG